MLHKDEIKKEKEKEKEKDKIDNDKRLADEMEELEDLQDNEINCNSKISSSMRFSLLKKRFSKQYTFNYQSYQNNLQTECYIKN
jgi:hypothetical protein